LAYCVVKFLKIPADLFFGKRYAHRAVILETVAGVPGMPRRKHEILVGFMIRGLQGNKKKIRLGRIAV
jgi:hypothetical protein